MKSYRVEDLKDQYAESYDQIPDEYKDLRDRGYDIIDKVEIGGVLFVGINPSYDESRKGTDASIVRKSDTVGDSDGYNYEPYFGRPKLLNEKIGISGFSHVDLFSIRCRQQYRVRNMVCDSTCKAFVEKQLGLFRKVVDGTLPRCIVVINAMASNLIREGNALGQLQYDEALGVDMYEVSSKRIPVFYSGMLSGAHALDNGSYDRLLWHIKYVLKHT